MTINPDPKEFNDSERFRDARDRYFRSLEANESKAKQKVGDGGIEASLKQFLRENSKSIKKETSSGGFGDGVKLPLPVKPIDPEGLAMAARTNANIQKLVDKMKPSKSFGDVIKIDDSKLAQESTMQVISYLMNKLLQTSLDLAQSMVGGVTGFLEWAQGSFVKQLDREDKERGWFAKGITGMINKIRGIGPKTDTMIERLLRYSKDSVDWAKKAGDRLQTLIELQLMQLSTKTEDARLKLVEKGLIKDEKDPDKKVGAFRGLADAVLPEDSVIRKALGVAGSIGSMFGFLGKMGANQLGAMGVTMASIKAASPVLAKVLGVFGGIGGFIALIAGSTAFSMVYAAFKNPDQMMGYLGAFGTLFNENILPTFKWISTEIVPLLAMAFTGLLYAGEKLADVVGTVINKTLIFILGTSLPRLLNLIGGVFVSMWDAFKEIGKRIIGIFGVGEHGKENIFFNISGIFTAIAKMFLNIAGSALEWIGQWAADGIRLLGLADAFGLRDGEGLWGRFKRFIAEDIPNFAIGLFNSMVDKIAEWTGIADPIGAIKESFMSLIDGLKNFIPSWDSIKRYLAGAIESAPGPRSLKNWLIGHLMGKGEEADPAETPTETSPSMYDKITGFGSRALDRIRGIPDAVDTTDVEARLKEAGEIIGNKIQEGIDIGRDKSGPLIEAAENRLNEMGKRLGEATSSVAAGGVTIIDAATNTVNNSSMSSVAERVRDKIPPLMSEYNHLDQWLTNTRSY